MASQSYYPLQTVDEAIAQQLLVSIKAKAEKLNTVWSGVPETLTVAEWNELLGDLKERTREGIIRCSGLASGQPETMQAVAYDLNRSVKGIQLMQMAGREQLCRALARMVGRRRWQKAVTVEGRLAVPVEALEVSELTLVALRRLEVRTLGQVCDRSEADWLRTRGFAAPRVDELKVALGRLGMTFRPV